MEKKLSRKQMWIVLAAVITALVVVAVLLGTLLPRKGVGVTFKNGGETLSEQTIKEGELPELPTATAGEGHFSGWYFDEALTEPYGEDAFRNKKGEITLYAKFEPHTEGEWNKDATGHWKQCTACGQKIGETVAHGFGEWITVTAPDVGIDGQRKRICAACGFSETETTEGLRATEGLALSLLDDGTGYQVDGIGTATDTEVVIPAVYNGKPVLGINNNAFMANMTITSLTFPSTLTKIGWNALRIVNLKEIKVAADNAYFKDVDGVLYSKQGENILLYPKARIQTSYSIEAGTLKIDLEAFTDNEALTNLTLPASLTSIDRSALTYMRNLTDITVEADNAYFKDVDGVLYSKRGDTLIKYPVDKALSSFVVPSNVEWISYDAFFENRFLTSVTLPSGLKTIMSSAFSGCTALTSITIPASLREMEGNAFAHCAALRSVIFEANSQLSNIHNSAFSLCTALTDIVLPDGVQIIFGEAFYGCESLTSIKIPVNVTAVEYDSFVNCNNLKTVFIDSQTVASGIDSDQSAGYLCQNATTVYIKSDVTTVGSYITNNFTKTQTAETIDGTSYYKWDRTV